MKKELTTQEEIEGLMDLKKKLRDRINKSPLKLVVDVFNGMLADKVKIDRVTTLLLESTKEEAELMEAIAEKYTKKADEEIKLLLAKLNQEVNR